MENVYYVKRLEKPSTVNNIFAFGGGLKNGGISEEAFKLLSGILSFDYMGFAEFEWGAVPTAIKTLFTGEDTISFEMDCNSHPVYVICPKAIEEDVMNWITKASIEHMRLKERLGFKEALAKENYADTVGWLKIEDDRICEEPFMFFIDKDMFEGVCKLFSLKSETVVLT